MKINLFGANCKRGNAVLDGIVIIVFVLVFGLFIIFGKSVLDEVNTDIQNDDDISPVAKNVTGNLNTVYTPLFNNLYLFAFILLVIFVLVSVFLIDTHPIFFIASFLLLIGVFAAALLLANTYEDIASDDSISSYANEFTYISYITDHLLELIITVGFLVSIALFIKFKLL